MKELNRHVLVGINPLSNENELYENNLDAYVTASTTGAASAMAHANSADNHEVARSACDASNAAYVYAYTYALDTKYLNKHLEAKELTVNDYLEEIDRINKEDKEK